MSGLFLQLVVVFAVLAAPPAPAPELGAEAQAFWPPNSNPTNLLIIPRKGQTADQQLADQLQCYDDVCEELQWDPFLAYDELVADGYAVALERRDLERGLVFLAIYGAEVGAVAGDLAGKHHGGSRRGAEMGAAISVAIEIINSQYLLNEESPATKRVISGYERELRKWVRKYSACMSRRGYKID